MVGPAGAGKYRVAKNFAGILHKVAGPLYGAIYPEVARLIFARQRAVFIRLFIEVSLGAAAVALLACVAWYVLGEIILTYTVGAAYLDTLPTIYVFTLAYAVFFLGFCCRPTLLAFQKLKAHVIVGFWCTLAFFVVAIALIPHVGYIGAAWGQLACYAVEMALSIYVIYRAVQAYDWSAPVPVVARETESQR
jgi:O-antigen/teichoic acid export membrane protein